MKTEDEIKKYYKKLSNQVEIPPCPEELRRPAEHGRSNSIRRFLLAACLAAAFIPITLSAGKPSELAVRAAEFSRRQNIESRIINGVTELHKLSSPIFSGGIK